MGRFAHIADTHIGAWREPILAEQNMLAFKQAMNKCKEKKVDFIIFSGDLFDSNIPDLEQVREAAEIIRDIGNSGIRIYVTYGSHDFSPTATSIIDVLASAGLFTKIADTDTIGVKNDQSLQPVFFEDKPTGAKLVGVYGRKNGLEKAYFEMLSLKDLEKETGFKIFVFHSAITELIPKNLFFGDSIPLVLLPKDFGYYAGGHIHTKILEKIPDYGTIAFPGALFGYRFTDLEDQARGTRRGFFIIDFDDEKIQTAFEELDLPEVVTESIDGTDKTPAKLNEILKKYVNSLDCDGKIVLIKISGILASGKPSDVNVSEIRSLLERNGVLAVHINRRALHPPEQIQPTLSFQTKEEIEDELINDFVDRFQNDPTLEEGEISDNFRKKFTAENGVATAKILLNALQDEKKDNEKKDDFEVRMLSHAMRIISCGDE